jgi:hypothetical protein
MSSLNYTDLKSSHGTLSKSLSFYIAIIDESLLKIHSNNYNLFLIGNQRDQKTELIFELPYTKINKNTNDLTKGDELIQKIVEHYINRKFFVSLNFQENYFEIKIKWE